MSDKLRVTGMNSGMDTESIITALVSSKKTAVDDAKKSQTKLQWKQDLWKDLNSKIYSLYTGSISTMKEENTYNQKKSTVSGKGLTVTAGVNAVNGVQTARVTSLAKAAYLTGGKVTNVTDTATKIKGDTKLSDLGITDSTSITMTTGTTSPETDRIDITADMTVNDLAKAFKDAGINASFDEGNQRLFLSAKTTGAEKNFDLSADAGILAKLGLDQTGTAVKIDGTDAAMTLNGAAFTSSTNTFEINGSTYVANEITDGEVSIVTDTDTSGIYDSIKSFLKNYNEVINELSKNHNADSSKGYEPLTDEEKESMTDSQVADWEKKIKDSLLRKDETLSSVISAMRDTMLAGVKMDGEMVYLTDFGIGTMGYFEAEKNERYAYHIDGDKDDSYSKTNADKLSATIASDPEKVGSFFRQLSTNMYEMLTEKMGRTEYSSIYKVYNDKQMKSEYSDYTTKISELQQKLSDYEDKYYKKFASMETAMAKMNSTQSSLSALFQ